MKFTGVDRDCRNVIKNLYRDEVKKWKKKRREEWVAILRQSRSAETWKKKNS